ncbi:MAG: OmpH family outer membrane protein [Ignavibacteriales bacterium]|nr:OmpH family outer membrane protein [Ignavibacteriales bacterium]
MKRIVIVLLVVFAATATHAADMKIGYVNSESIMQQLPEAQDAQKQLDGVVAEWQGELSKQQADLQKKFDEYDKRKLTMSDERRADMEKKIQGMDNAIVEYRTRKFGTSGELFTKTNELMKPIQDKIFKAIKDIADEGGYDYVFDKSSTTLLMFANEKHDLTTSVLAKLQLK